ncbi:hypothetical protein FCH28_17145 [Streptomyces piniterrae]|uniref:Uncharacterized protein n=1 Tax=Streptomyces piniterrae TaxID=2571125 RepID=A0A4U0NFS0_9ACTN|nr:hypothetical protein FCH28_17145 [Streptomyces piniterrae]
MDGRRAGSRAQPPAGPRCRRQAAAVRDGGGLAARSLTAGSNVRDRSGYAHWVDPKTRNRIMSGLFAVLLIVVIVAAAVR